MTTIQIHDIMCHASKDKNDLWLQSKETNNIVQKGQIVWMGIKSIDL